MRLDRVALAWMILSAPLVGALPIPSLIQGDECGLIETVGCIRWSTITGDPDEGSDLAGLVPSADGRLLFTAGEFAARDAQGRQLHSTRIGALNASTGETIWSWSAPGTPVQRTHDMKVAGGGLFASMSHKPALLIGRWNATSGDPLWTTALSPVPDTVPNGPSLVSARRLLAVDTPGTRVFVVASQNSMRDYMVIAALDGTTGSLLWRKDIVGTAYASDLGFSADERTLFVRSFFRNTTTTSHLQAIDTETGNFVWQVLSVPGGTLGAEPRLFVSPNGTEIHVAGAVQPAGQNLDATQVATFNATTGALLRSGVYSDDLLALTSDTGLMRPHELYAISFAMSPDGTRIYATGVDAPLGICSCDFEYNVGTIAIDIINGKTVWFSHWAADDDDDWFALAMDVAPDGTIMVGALTAPASSAQRIAALVIDPVSGLTVSATQTPPGNMMRPRLVAFTPDSHTGFVGSMGAPTTFQTPGAIFAVATRAVAADLPPE